MKQAPDICRSNTEQDPVIVFETKTLQIDEKVKNPEIKIEINSPPVLSPLNRGEVGEFCVKQFLTNDNCCDRYNEVCHPGYNFDNGQFSSGTGHFTQVIWKGSTKLGIGRVEKHINGMRCAFIVGRYQSAGNWFGDFAENVPKGNFDPSYCDTISSKRRKYYDAKGNPVIAVTPLTEVDVPEETNGKSGNAHFHAHGYNTKRLNGKEKN